MSDFTIFPDQILSAGESLNQIAGRLQELSQEAAAVTRQVQIDSAAMTTVRGALNAACESMDACSRKVSLLGGTLREAVSQYSSCENRLLGISPDRETTVVEVPVRALGAQSKVTAKSKAYSISAEAGKTVTIAEKKFEKPLKKEDEKETETEGSGSGKKTKKSSGKKAEEYGIGSAGTSGSVSGSIWDVDKDFAYGKAHAEALSASASGSFSAGLFVQDNGDKLTADPRISASAGVTLCALAAEAEGELGTSKAGIKGSVDAAVGKAEATATLNAGLHDKKGNFDPSVKVKASAELTAAEANATVTGTLAGVQAKVTAGAKVGLGAHANFTIGVGTVSADMGAALGIGANIGFDINVSGAVRAICDLAQSIKNVFKG